MGGRAMKNKEEKVDVFKREADKQANSPLDLIRLLGGHSRRTKAVNSATDGMLASYADRVTYTFVLNDEVASIHFDRLRGEIFFKGHNIRNIDLTNSQREALYYMKEVMAADDRARLLLSDYEATLGKCLTDK